MSRRGPRWSQFIITSHCSVWPQRGLPLDKVRKQLGSQTPVGGPRTLCPPPLLGRRRPLPNPLPTTGCEGIAAFGPGSESSLFQRNRRWGRQAFGGKEGPSAKKKSEMLLWAPAAPSTVHSGSSAGPGTGTETRRQPLSVSEQRAAGWAPEEGGPETVARETAGLSQSAPAIRLGGGGRSMGRCCPLVVDGGAGGPARLCHQAAGGTADVSPSFQAPG